MYSENMSRSYCELNGFNIILGGDVLRTAARLADESRELEKGRDSVNSLKSMFAYGG